MTAVQTLQAPKAKRLPDGFAPQSRRKTNEEMPQELYEQFCRVCRNCRICTVFYDCRVLIEGQKQEGVPEEDIITMAEVVTICKEARAERYAEEQALANRI